MAINYTNFGTKLGKIVKKTFSLNTLAGTTLPNDLAEIVAAYGTTDTGKQTAQAPLEGLHQLFLALMESVRSAQDQLALYANPLVTDYDTITSQLDGVVSDSDLYAILSLILFDMSETGETVQQSVVTVGSASANANNIGNGILLVDKVLDGFSAPTPGGIPHMTYNLIDSELAPADVTHMFTCLADSYGGSASEGEESFSWTNQPAFADFSPIFDNPGPGPSIATTTALSILSNTDFDNWANGIPSSWTSRYGVGNTDFEQSAAPYRGTYALQINGSASLTPTLYQSLAGRLIPLRRHVLTFHAKASGTHAGATFQVTVKGTGFPSMAQISLPLTSLGSSYAHYSVYFNTPLELPGDAEIEIRLLNANTSASVTVSNLALAGPTYHAGVNAIIVPGSTPFAINDRIALQVTSSEGLIQGFARKLWKIQFPSLPAAPTAAFLGLLPMLLFTTSPSGPTIPDSLAS